MILGRVAGDRLTGLLGPVALARRGGLLAAAGLALGLVVPEPAVAILGFGCLGAGLAAVVPLVFRAAAHVPGVAPGVGIAAVSTVGYLGFLAGPPLVGAIAELAGLRAGLALVVALLGALALLAGALRRGSRS
jgi:hypothetical protein